MTWTSQSLSGWVWGERGGGDYNNRLTSPLFLIQIIWSWYTVWCIFFSFFFPFWALDIYPMSLLLEVTGALYIQALCIYMFIYVYVCSPYIFCHWSFLSARIKSNWCNRYYSSIDIESMEEWKKLYEKNCRVLSMM